MRLPPKAGESLCVRLFFALAFVAFTCVFPYVASVNNPNENVRTYMTMAMVEDHTFKIDKIVARYGWVNDMAKAPDKQTGEFHLYSVKAPAVSYAGAPVYWAFTKLAPRWGRAVPTDQSSQEERVWWFRNTTLVLRLFTIQLPCFFFLVWFERFLRGVSRDVVLRLCAVAAAGLGTNYLAYSMMFASHAPFACAAFASFALTTRERSRYPTAKQRRISRAFLSGFFAGLVTLLEYHGGPVSAALGLYALATWYRPTRLFAFGLGAAMNAGALMFFQKRAFGDPFMPGHRMSENPEFAKLLNQGLFGIGKPSFTVFKDISFSRSFGFFGTSPFMWLGLLVIPFGLFVSARRNPDRAWLRASHLVWLLTMLVLWGTVSAAINWRGGWTVGPRYLGAAPPFFAYGAVCALEELSGHRLLRRTIARGIAGGCAIASVAQTGLVSLVFNTLPESISRPLPQFAIPLARAGFVPHHVGELFGKDSPTIWYVVVGCLFAAVIVVALWPHRDRWFTWPARAFVVGLAFMVAIRPAMSAQGPDEEGDEGVSARRDLTRTWEPPGRDRITTMRALVDKHPKPCAYLELADLEKLVEWREEAAADERRAGGTPRAVCR